MKTGEAIYWLCFWLFIAWLGGMAVSMSYALFVTLGWVFA